MSSNTNATGQGGTRIRNHVRALNLILIAADSAGLAMPEVVRAGSHDVDLLFFDLSAFLAWATWAETDLDSITVRTTDEATHHTVSVDLLDQQVDMTAVIPLVCPKCQQPQRDHTAEGLAYDDDRGRTHHCAYTPTAFAYDRARAAERVPA